MSAVGNAIVLTKPVKVFTGTKTGEIPSPSTDDMTKLLSLISTATSRAVEMTDTGIALQLSPQKNKGDSYQSCKSGWIQWTVLLSH